MGFQQDEVCRVKASRMKKHTTEVFVIRITANKYVMPDIQQPLTWYYSCITFVYPTAISPQTSMLSDTTTSHKIQFPPLGLVTHLTVYSVQVSVLLSL